MLISLLLTVFNIHNSCSSKTHFHLVDIIKGIKQIGCQMTFKRTQSMRWFDETKTNVWSERQALCQLHCSFLANINHM